ncbi:hypothetical protein dsx2_3064 [Desulfovibrio sp. X2]|uniref:DVU0524 family FlgM-associated protein n=1 Tax=Desulfovibrio sp. X2 TaxID=941449 RepID=UPI000358B7D2|nr:DVU0524 family FlgM-associated protein [Desulfovibrio sp. X2]EPR41714.1 hypothetical protein dsx2_3064 [Desulfovibrio sp. X2]
MLTNPYQIRTMLRTYGKQLVNARRLARFQRRMHGADGDGADGNNAATRDLRRQALVEKVAREIIDNLVVTGVENPLVEHIKEELEKRVGGRLLFEYPFMEQELQILRQNDGDGAVLLSPEETHEVLATLWEITTRAVDETML